MGSDSTCTVRATDDGPERSGAATASMTLPPKASNVTAELGIRMPKWFAKNVRHVCDGGMSRLGRYRDTVVCENSAEAGSPDDCRIDAVGGGLCLRSRAVRTK